MQARSRRGWRLSAFVALAWLSGGAAVCEAQLFPNLPIRRKKNDCEQEAPFYKYIRQNHYGYYPTCWRSFPPGWACPCPNPNAPNWEASKREIPLQTAEESFLMGGGLGGEGEEDLMDQPGGREPAPGGRRTAPELPPGRSPFDLDPGQVNPPPGLRDRGNRPTDPFAPPGGGGQASRRRTTTPASAGGPAATAPASALPPIDLPEGIGEPPTSLPPLPPGRDDAQVNPTALPSRGFPTSPPRRTGLLGSIFGRPAPAGASRD